MGKKVMGTVTPRLGRGVLVLLLLSLVAGGGLLTQRFAADGASASSPTVAAPPELLFTLHGSNTIGARLAPAMVEAWLRQRGAAEVRWIPGTVPVELRLEATMPGGRREAVAIAAHGSTTAFKGLAANGCEVGMSSRPVKAKEVAQMAALGSLTAPGAENVVAMDGIAVIVHPGNGAADLTIDQIARLFAGEITHWSQIPGSGIDAPVTVFARDDNSGTWDTFNSLVLQSKSLQLSPAAQRYEDSGELSRQVSQSVGGIGFIGLPYIAPSKAVRVSDSGTRPIAPTAFAVATEDYLLARRLFLYVPPKQANAAARDFVRFALSAAGQQAATDTGFVSLNLFEEEVTLATDLPESYRNAAAGAMRLSINFRFRPGSDRPDTKTLRDMDRLMDYLRQPENQGRRLRLFGFADHQSLPAEACEMARKRAEHVSKVLGAFGLVAERVEGFCGEMPVAAPGDEGGGLKNHRVELWIDRPAG